MTHGQQTSDTISGWCILSFLLVALFALAWKVAALCGVGFVTVFLVGSLAVYKKLEEEKDV